MTKYSILLLQNQESLKAKEAKGKDTNRNY
jgi:hypothetical protein